MKYLKVSDFVRYVLTALVIAVAFQSTAYAIEEQQLQEYVIGAEDVLEVLVWKNADLSKQVNVRPDGMITLPLIGDVKAAGLTTEVLRKGIVERLKEYQENAVVSIIVRDINSYKIYVLGEVVRPGAYTLKAKTTLIQAIALAGGFTQFASKNNIVVLREKTGKGGKAENLTFSLKKIVRDGSPDKNPVLMPGDTIFVP